jgi:hypothetical protein
MNVSINCVSNIFLYFMTIKNVATTRNSAVSCDKFNVMSTVIVRIIE